MGTAALQGLATRHAANSVVPAVCSQLAGAELLSLRALTAHAGLVAAARIEGYVLKIDSKTKIAPSQVIAGGGKVRWAAWGAAARLGVGGCSAPPCTSMLACRPCWVAMCTLLSAAHAHPPLTRHYAHTPTHTQRLLYFHASQLPAGKHALALAAWNSFGVGMASEAISYTHVVRALGPDASWCMGLDAAGLTLPS